MDAIDVRNSDSVNGWYESEEAEGVEREEQLIIGVSVSFPKSQLFAITTPRNYLAAGTRSLARKWPSSIH